MNGMSMEEYAQARAEYHERIAACLWACRGITTAALDALPDGELARLVKTRGVDKEPQA